MQISDIRIKLMENRTDRLKAFCSVTFDGAFVVRDLKIIEGAGAFFVAMPSRKITARCPQCRGKNHLRAKFCNDCGVKLPDASWRGDSGRTKLHTDVAHPINQAGRDYIQNAIVEAYKREVELSRQPGYQPSQLEEFDDDYAAAQEGRPAGGEAQAPASDGDQSSGADEASGTNKPADADKPLEGDSFSEGIF